VFLPSYHKGALPTPDGALMPYVIVGDGPVPVVVIPSGGDGLTVVSDAALRLAWFFRKRARDYRVLILGRRQPIPLDHGVERHAEDMIWAMEQLGWGAAVLECNSAGGPVGQWISVKRPDLARVLILSCALHRADDHFRSVVRHWHTLADERRWPELNWSSIEYTYRRETVKKLRPLKPLLRLISRPRYPERILRIFEELFDLDNRPILPRITTPTLVIGGEDDRLIGASIQREMAGLLPSSSLKLYPGYGHGNDLENPDYQRQVDEFVRRFW